MSESQDAKPDLSDIDIFDPEIYERGVPHEQFKRLRAHDPVHFQKEKNGRGYWAVTRHADIHAISRDPATFSSERGATFITDYAEDSEELMGMRFTSASLPSSKALARFCTQWVT